MERANQLNHFYNRFDNPAQLLISHLPHHKLQMYSYPRLPSDTMLPPTTITAGQVRGELRRLHATFPRKGAEECLRPVKLLNWGSPFNMFSTIWHVGTWSGPTSIWGFSWMTGQDRSGQQTLTLFTGRGIVVSISWGGWGPSTSGEDSCWCFTSQLHSLVCCGVLVKQH